MTSISEDPEIISSQLDAVKNTLQTIVEEVVEKVVEKVDEEAGEEDGEEVEPYRFSKVFNSDCNEISLKKAFSNYQIYDMKEKLINMGERDPSVGLIKNIEYYFPRIFSIFSYGRSEKELKHGLISPLTEKKKKERNKKGNTGYDNPDISEKISTAKELLPMLAAFRSDDYGDWMKIGWLLYNECNGCNEAMELWLEFSGKSDKYDEAHCMDVWDKMTKRDDCAKFNSQITKHFFKYTLCNRFTIITFASPE